MANTTSKKLSILKLPLSPSLPEFLNADPLVPSVDALFSLSSYSSEEANSAGGQQQLKPSTLRRSRQVKAHFSYTTPLPLSFPYSVKPGQYKPRKVPGEAVGDGAAVTRGAPEEAKKTAAKESREPQVPDVEDYLASLEPDWNEGVTSASNESTAAYTSESRREVVGTPKLVGLSQKCLDEILPNLDTGDAADFVLNGKKGDDQQVATREELTSFLAGHTVVAKKPSQDHEKGFAPWSLCYGGHQFGSWASQLGDGRAISILTTPAKWPVYHEDTYYPPVAELQLKGAGRTPYSRFADGLAVLRSSVREYLGSEAMAALSIPTSRALSLVHLPDVDVMRERLETGAIVCRVAPSWVRIGSFELPWSRDDWDGLRDLANYAGHQVFGVGASQEGEQSPQFQDTSLAAIVLREASRRNARTFAGWQAAGFMHGVLNTDNINITGCTIDYGPYAWMDVYSAGHICNHSDSEGRYSYRNQPPIGVEAVHRLGNALAELIGCELEMAKKSGDGQIAEAARGWASEANKHDSWREQAEPLIEEIATEFTSVYTEEYRRRMGQRLGLLDPQQSDFSEFVNPMLSLMAEQNLDFSRTFRLLGQFTTVDSPHIDRFLEMLCPKSAVPKFRHDTCEGEWREWLTKYQTRVQESEKAAGLDAQGRRERMNAANPRFILRQWVLEEAIKRLEQDHDVKFLQKVLDMATHPFEDYGEELVDPTQCSKPSAETQEEIRLCGIGDATMLGFQCSCSS